MLWDSVEQRSEQGGGVELPIYEYKAKNPRHACPHCRDRFEVRQAMSDPRLERCPECGAPVERLISLCGMSTRPSGKALLSDKNIKRHGFTKLVNEGDGRFRKT